MTKNEDIYAVVDETGSIGFRKPMTPSDLGEIRKRCEAATEGSWWFAYATVRKSLGDDDEYSVADLPRVAGDTETRQGGADGEFIAHARTDVPALLNEVERLNRRIAQLESNRPKCMGTWLKGSGGHRQYAHDCPNPGRWDVMGGGYVCDEHKSTKGADDDAWTIDDELRMLRDAISEDKESLVERSLMYKAERDAARAEIADLRRRPPMSCTACEIHNQDLADKNCALQFENDELRDAISDDAAAALADRNEIRDYLNAVLDALMFAGEKVDLDIEYKDAGARAEALVEEVRRWRNAAKSLGRVHQPEDLHTVASGLADDRARLALLEPVWETAKVVHEIRQRMNVLDDLHYDALDNEFGDAVAAMGRAIDAALAAEAK